MKRNNMVENLIIEVASLGIFDELTEEDIGKLVKKTVEKYGVDDNPNIIKAEIIKKAINENEKKKMGKNIKENVPLEENDLRKLFKIAKDRQEHPYDLLNQRGYIKNPIKEFVKAE